MLNIKEETLAQSTANSALRRLGSVGQNGTIDHLTLFELPLLKTFVSKEYAHLNWFRLFLRSLTKDVETRIYVSPTHVQKRVQHLIQEAGIYCEWIEQEVSLDIEDDLPRRSATLHVSWQPCQYLRACFSSSAE